jgi:hypothetical protein
VGTEVVVAIPHGEIDAGPVIIGTLPSAIPAELDERTTVMTAPTIVLKSGAGSYVEIGGAGVLLGAKPGTATFHPVAHGDTVREKLNAALTQLNALIAYVNSIAPGTVPPVPGTASPTVAALAESALSDRVSVS